MNCRKCGTEIQDWYNFCPKCAKPVPGAVISLCGGKEYHKDDILKIAQYQRWILCAAPFLVVLGAINLSIMFSIFELPEFLAEVVPWLHLVSMIFYIFYIVVFCLLRAAEKGNVLITVLEVILLFFHVIFILVSLLAVLSATRILESAGLKVGLLGVSKKTLDKFLMKEKEKGNDTGTSEAQKIKKILSVSFVCLVLVLLSVSAVRQFTSFFGAEADDKIEQLRKDAEQGDAVSQFELGWCYDFGEGVEKDMKQAAEWYRKAADQGVANAQFNLGNCYLNGEGVEKDPKMAVHWYRKAAEQGNAYAQFNLGCCYLNGEGVEKDLKQAVYWYRKAADQGNAYARFNLGQCYFNGKGVEKDLKQGAEWFRKAAEQGDADAQYNIGLCCKKGWGVEKDMKQAAEWFRKAAEQGNTHAQFSLGSCYDGGLGIAKDHLEAIKWYRKVSDYYDSKLQYHTLCFCECKRRKFFFRKKFRRPCADGQDFRGISISRFCPPGSGTETIPHSSFILSS